MKELITLSIIYISFFVASFFFYKKMIKVKLIWVCIFIPIYLIGLYLYFDLLIELHNCLRDRQIYLEFGHADEVLLLLEAFCFLNVGVLVILICINRIRNKHKLH